MTANGGPGMDETPPTEGTNAEPAAGSPREAEPEMVAFREAQRAAGAVTAGERFGVSEEARGDQQQGLPSFQESAKKFRPGPVAPRESETDRPDMSGAAPAAATVEAAEAAEAPTDDPAGGRMSDGEPGVSKKMPGEA